MKRADPCIVPKHKKTGCLPRKSKLGQWFPLASERVEVIPRGEWPQLIDQVTNSALKWMQLDQDGVGSCASEAMTAAIMASRELQGQPQVALNPWFAYHFVSGGVDRGSSIDENLRFARETGVASMDVWPRSMGWRSRPSDDAMDDAQRYRIDEAYDVTTVDELVSCILKGFPVVFGYRPGGGGHAVLAMDVVSMSAFKFLNSWGDWGEDGFGTLRFDQIDWRFGAWAVRATNWSSTI